MIGLRSSGPAHVHKGCRYSKDSNAQQERKRKIQKQNTQSSELFHNRIIDIVNSQPRSRFPFTSRQKAIVLHPKSLNPTRAMERPENFNPPINPVITLSTVPLLLTQLQNHSHIVYNLPISDDGDPANLLRKEIDRARSLDDWNPFLFATTVGETEIDVGARFQHAESRFAGCERYWEDAVLETNELVVVMEGAYVGGGG